MSIHRVKFTSVDSHMAMYFGRVKSTSMDNTSLVECNDQMMRHFGLMLRGCVYLQLVVDFIVFHFYMPNVAARPCISGM